MQADTDRAQFDPETSIRTGTRKFKQFRDRWLGIPLRKLGVDLNAVDRQTMVRWVATAYNAGQRTVLKAVEYARAAGDEAGWMRPEHFQRALLYTGAYSLRQAARSCLSGRGEGAQAEQLTARAQQERQCLKGQSITLDRARTSVSPLLLCAVEFKHRNLPRYVDRILTYIRYYDQARSGRR